MLTLWVVNQKQKLFGLTKTIKVLVDLQIKEIVEYLKIISIQYYFK